MPELINRTWTVTVMFPGKELPVTRKIQAAYTTTDDSQPGWTLLKDKEHKIVYQVRSDICIDIQRTDDKGTTT